MISNVDIKNYRGFPSYRMESLSRVNLLVGKNNCGKTALLEAVQILASGGAPEVLGEIGHRRGELCIGVFDSLNRAYIDPSHFFHLHFLNPELSIKITSNDAQNLLTIKVIPASPKKIEVETDDNDIAETASTSILEIEFASTEKNNKLALRITQEGGVDFERLKRFGINRNDSDSVVRFISSDSMDARQLATLSDQIKVLRKSEQIVDSLRILDDEVRVFDFLSGMPRQSRYPGRAGAFIGRKDEKTLVPLGSMGDGMRRILALAMSLTCTNDGTLCIDEIDTGLHYSAMQDMWKLVIEQATRCNVQVFASTHSWDCIEGLSKICQDEPKYQNRVSIQKIDRTLNHSIAFAGDSIAKMEKHHIDPR